MSVSDKKTELRSKLLTKRSSISDDDWNLRSLEIIENLKTLKEFQSSSTIHSFVSMNDRKEVNTHELIKELLGLNIKVIVPIADFKTGELQHSILTTFDDLEPNKWGVLEPLNADSDIDDIDIILVPLLAADKKFNRLGYGKGFYDRFLKSTDAIKVGLLFDDFILQKIPVEDFDEKLDILITEKKILRRNNR
tara:strand:- start:791 stop:1369 length:579 start_codon:yes stop_codon:yes gene_type:complete